MADDLADLGDEVELADGAAELLFLGIKGLRRGGADPVRKGLVGAYLPAGYIVVPDWTRRTVRVFDPSRGNEDMRQAAETLNKCRAKIEPKPRKGASIPRVRTCPRYDPAGLERRGSLSEDQQKREKEQDEHVD